MLRPKLFHIEHQPLQILTFGVIDVDRVVGGLCELMQDAHLATRLGCRTEHCQAELLFRHGLRAREGEQYATFLYLLKCLGIDFAITY